MSSKYRVSNWSSYNKALKTRGSLTFWLSADCISGWYSKTDSKKRGKPRIYSDSAIECVLRVRSFFHLPLRGVQGFIDSIFSLANIGHNCPDYSTLSRRLSGLDIKLNNLPKSKSLHILIDGSGIKYYGPGEWHKSKFKNSPQRFWKKICVAVDLESRDTIAFTFTDQHCSEKQQLPKLLDNIKNPLDRVTADGGFESYKCYEAIEQRGAKAIIPPRRNATLVYQGDGKKPPPQRQSHVQAIQKSGLTQWKIDVDYHKRSIVENQFFRIKKMFGEKLRSKLDSNRANEIALILDSINRFNKIGLSSSIRA